MKLASWNINGLRAVMKKGELENFLAHYDPDILCLQEVKIQPSQVDFTFPGYKLILNCAERPGYSGTGLLVKDNLIVDSTAEELVARNIPDDIADEFRLSDDSFGNPNTEGRILSIELPDYYVVTVYTPNSKGDLGRLDLRYKQWDPAFLQYMQQLRQAKPVIFCGDLNVAATEIDLANPKGNKGKHGFTEQERVGFSNIIKSGFVDSFRHIHGDIPEQYTWWSHWANARARNIGWRIDYFLVDDSLADKIKNANIYSTQLGSDHCPISVTIE